MLAGYGLILTLQFRSVAQTYPVTEAPEARQVLFYKRGYTGTAALIEGSDTPVIREAGSDEFFGIRPTRLTIGLSLESFYLSDFFGENNRDIHIVYQRGPLSLFDTTPTGEWVDVFRGWLEPFGAKEAYQKLGYIGTVEASCGIGSLEDYPFWEYPTTRQLSGIQSFRVILQNCLRWTGMDLPLWISMATWAKPQTLSTTGLVPTQEALSWARVDVDLFKKNSEPQTCKQVLEAICNTFNAVLYQQGGAWRFLRVDELPVAGTSAREWVEFKNQANSTPYSVTEDVAIVIDPDYMPDEGGNLNVEPGKEAHKVTFDYGDLYNILLNGDFSAGLTGWGQADAARFYPAAVFPQEALGYPRTVIGTGEEDSPYRLRITGRSVDSARQYDTPTIWQKVVVPRETRTLSGALNANVPPVFNVGVADPHLLKLRLKYQNFNVAGPKIRLWVLTTNRRGTETIYSLDQSGVWQSGNKYDIYHLPKSVYKDGSVERAKPSDGEDFEIEASEPVPGVGPYTVYVELFAGTPVSGADPAQPYIIEYRDIRLTREVASQVIITKDNVDVRQYAFDPLRRTTKEEITLTIGSQLNTKAGSTLRLGCVLNPDSSPALEWRFALSSGTLTTSLQELCALGRLRLTRSHVRTFEGTVAGYIELYSVISFPELGYVGLVVSSKIDDLLAESDIKVVELLTPITGAIVKRSYETPDGAVLPMSGTGDILPSTAEPSAPGKLSPTVRNILTKLSRGPLTVQVTPVGGGGVGIGVHITRPADGKIINRIDP